MARKRKYYRVEPLLKTGASYLVLLGMRSNGKSYAVKERVLTDAFKEGKNFVYLRRWREDIKQAGVEAYFADMPVDKITDGKYDAVVAWQGYLYFGIIDDLGKVERGQRIGRYCALNESVRYKSQAFVDYKYIVYEEFITDEVYLAEEPTKLQHFVSTVARLEDLTVFLIGNTMSRVCPYFSEWNLQGTLRQKQGTIELYHLHKPDGGTVEIAVENCEAIANTSNMFFGTAAKQIVTGEWDVKESPRLPEKLDTYDECYRMDVKMQLMHFHVSLLVDPAGQLLVYIFPGKHYKKGTRLITDAFTNDPMATRYPRKDSRAEVKMIECFRQGKVCYSDNLTAADFNNTNRQYHIF